jgi:hypothetical protein
VPIVALTRLKFRARRRGDFHHAADLADFECSVDIQDLSHLDVLLVYLARRKPGLAERDVVGSRVDVDDNEAPGVVGYRRERDVG